MLQRWIRLVAIVSGALAISLPLLRLWLSRDTKLAGNIGRHLSWTRWPVVVILSILYISIGVLLWKPIPLTISPFLLLSLTLAGSIIYFPGIALYLWSFKILGRMYGVSTINAAQLYEQHQIIEDGVYSFVRHPMYLGVILVAIGALLIFRTWAMVVFTPSAFIVILRAQREEELLAREFGSSWADYCRRVPAWMPRSFYRKTKNNPRADN